MVRSGFNHSHEGTPKKGWITVTVENPIYEWMIGGTPILGNLQMVAGSLTSKVLHLSKMQHYDFAHRYLVLAPWQVTDWVPNGSREFVTNQLHLTGC